LPLPLLHHPGLIPLSISGSDANNFLKYIACMAPGIPIFICMATKG
jgi:hypothetical protein